MARRKTTAGTKEPARPSTITPHPRGGDTSAFASRLVASERRVPEEDERDRARDGRSRFHDWRLDREQVKGSLPPSGQNPDRGSMR
jgi:hypothetical protein